MIAGLIQHLLLAAGLAAVVAVFCRFARSRPAVCHGLWLLVLVKLAIPPGLVTPWRVPVALPVLGRGAPPPARPAPAVRGSIARGIDRPLPEAGSPAPTAGVERDAATRPPGEPVANGPGIPGACFAPVSRPARSEVGSGPALEDVLFWAIVALWIGGAVAAAGAHGLRLRRFRPLLSGAMPVPEALSRTVEAVAARLGVRPPETVVAAGPISPILWCVGRPRLVWPERLLDRLPREAWSDIAAHELAHLRRRDHWVGWLLLAAGLVWWWNPLFWITRRRLHFWAELACDAWVVKLRPAGRRRFARTLIEVSRLVSRAARPLPAMGMSAAAFQELERRLTMILHHRTAARVPLWGAFLLAVVGLAVLPGLSFSQDDDKPKKKNKTKTVVTETIVEVPVERRAAAEAAEDIVEDVAEEEEEVSVEAPVASAGGRGRRLSSFAPAQATGAPDTMGSGLKRTAWTPLHADAGEEWLVLQYFYGVEPRAIRIYETHHPGAVVKVCAVVGENAEVVLWEGEDPAPPGKSHAISTIGVDPRPVRGVKVHTIKIVLDTRRVKGRNAIDAVELIGEQGPQFACRAWASSHLLSAVPVDRAAAGTTRGGRAGSTHFFGRATRPVEAAPAGGSASASRRGRARPGVILGCGGGATGGSFGLRKATRHPPPVLRARVARKSVAPAPANRSTGRARPPQGPTPDPVPAWRIQKLEQELRELKKMIQRLEKRLGSDA